METACPDIRAQLYGKGTTYMVCAQCNLNAKHSALP